MVKTRHRLVQHAVPGAQVLRILKLSGKQDRLLGQHFAERGKLLTDGRPGRKMLIR